MTGREPRDEIEREIERDVSSSAGHLMKAKTFKIVERRHLGEGIQIIYQYERSDGTIQTNFAVKKY
jgi:hypothetical protein